MSRRIRSRRSILPVFTVDCGPSEDLADHEQLGWFRAADEATAIQMAQLQYIMTAFENGQNAADSIRIEGDHIEVVEDADFNHFVYFSASEGRS